MRQSCAGITENPDTLWVLFEWGSRGAWLPALPGMCLGIKIRGSYGGLELMAEDFVPAE